MPRRIPGLMALMLISACGKANDEVGRARSLVDQGEYEAAEEIYASVSDGFDRQLILWPSEALLRRSVLVEWGEIHDYFLGRSADAVTIYSRFVADYPRSSQAPELLLRIAELHEQVLGEPDEALSAYQLFLERYREHTQAHQALVRVAEYLLQSGNVDEGRSFLQEVEKRWPVTRQALEAALLRARSYALDPTSGGADKGLEILEAVLKEGGLAKSQQSLVWLEKGHYRKQNGDFKGAKAAYQRAAELNAIPGVTELLARLDKLEEEYGFSEQAYLPRIRRSYHRAEHAENEAHAATPDPLGLLRAASDEDLADLPPPVAEADDPDWAKAQEADGEALDAGPATKAVKKAAQKVENKNSPAPTKKPAAQAEPVPVPSPVPVPAPQADSAGGEDAQAQQSP